MPSNFGMVSEHASKYINFENNDTRNENEFLTLQMEEDTSLVSSQNDLNLVNDYLPNQINLMPSIVCNQVNILKDT